MEDRAGHLHPHIERQAAQVVPCLGIECGAEVDLIATQLAGTPYQTRADFALETADGVLAILRISVEKAEQGKDQNDVFHILPGFDDAGFFAYAGSFAVRPVSRRRGIRAGRALSRGDALLAAAADCHADRQAHVAVGLLLERIGQREPQMAPQFDAHARHEAERRLRAVVGVRSRSERLDLGRVPERGIPHTGPDEERAVARAPEVVVGGEHEIARGKVQIVPCGNLPAEDHAADAETDVYGLPFHVVADLYESRFAQFRLVGPRRRELRRPEGDAGAQLHLNGPHGPRLGLHASAQKQCAYYGKQRSFHYLIIVLMIGSITIYPECNQKQR